MNRARLRVIIGSTLLILIAAAFALMVRGPATSSPPADRPVLLLLTSLPLMFNEDFSLEGGGSDALTALEKHYRVVPISVTDAGELAKGRLLLMAHPLAQTAENLVALDTWVRRGGRALLLADPMLEWPSKRRLGDPLRPPPMFADTGLLGHWGLRLESPDKRGPKTAKLAGYEIMTASPGSLFGDRCRISADRLVADCPIGKGRAIVIADADVLDPADLGDGAERNLDAIIFELSELQR